MPLLLVRQPFAQEQFLKLGALFDFLQSTPLSTNDRQLDPQP